MAVPDSSCQNFCHLLKNRAIGLRIDQSSRLGTPRFAFMHFWIVSLPNMCYFSPLLPAKARTPKSTSGGNHLFHVTPASRHASTNHRFHLAQPHKKNKFRSGSRSFPHLRDTSWYFDHWKTPQNQREFQTMTWFNMSRFMAFCWAYSNSKTSGLIKGFTSKMSGHKSCWMTVTTIQSLSGYITEIYIYIYKYTWHAHWHIYQPFRPFWYFFPIKFPTATT